MPREPFYPIKKEAFLFPEQTSKAGDLQQPEEAVRQWCAFELIRAYGIRIDELEFERQVRLGSKTYRIDILVLRRGLPWIVVECKKPDHTKPEEGMAQAISYAKAQGIQAPFAVYTNGHEWHVQRLVREQWLSVPDLPMQRYDSPDGVPLTEILRALQRMAPLLHKLDESLAGAEAKKFLRVMQAFFQGNLLTAGTDRALLFGTDNLLRVLASADEDANYRLEKLAAARKAYEDYRKRVGLKEEFVPIDGRVPVAESNRELYATLMFLLEGAQGITGLDLLLLRLNIALTEYGMNQEPRKKSYPVLLPHLHGALTNFLDAAVAIHLNAHLPDALDRMLVGDMKGYCQLAWEQWKAD